MQLKKRYIRNTATFNEKTAPRGVKRSFADYDQTNNTHPVGFGGPGKPNRYQNLPAGDSSVCNNGRYTGLPRPCYQASFNPDKFKDNANFPKINERAIVHGKPDTFIPLSEAKRFRATSRMYKQRGITIAEISLRSGQHRIIQHKRRMFSAEVAGNLRDIGIIQPTPRQIDAAVNGSNLDEVLRMKGN